MLQFKVVMNWQAVVHKMNLNLFGVVEPVQYRVGKLRSKSCSLSNKWEAKNEEKKTAISWNFACQCHMSLAPRETAEKPWTPVIARVQSMYGNVLANLAKPWVTLGQISSTSQGFVAAFQPFLTSDLMSNWRLAICECSLWKRWCKMF